MTLFISIFYIILNVFSIKFVTHNVILGSRNATYYCIDKSVLVENRPLVKFIRNFIRDSSGVFSISSLGILMTSFPALHCCLCKNTLVYRIKRKFLPCNILYISGSDRDKCSPNGMVYLAQCSVPFWPENGKADLLPRGETP